MVIKCNFKHIQEESIKDKLKMLKRNINYLKDFEKTKAVIEYLNFMGEILKEVEEEFNYYTTHKFKYEERLKEIKEKGNMENDKENGSKQKSKE